MQLNWKEINFDAFGQTREEQQTKAFAHFRQIMDKHNIQFDTFRIQMQQKINDIDSKLTKIQTTTTPTTSSPPVIVEPKATTEAPAVPTDSAVAIMDELGRLRELLEETFAGQGEHHSSSTTGRAVIGSGSGTAITTTTATNRPPRKRTMDTSTTISEVQMQAFSQNINERVTDLQLAVNRLHQDVSSIRQLLDRISPLSTSLILGRSTTGRK